MAYSCSQEEGEPRGAPRRMAGGAVECPQEEGEPRGATRRRAGGPWSAPRRRGAAECSPLSLSS